VLSASVTVDKQLISSIGKGILVFAAVAPGDTEKDADALASKVLKLRLWDDENGGRVETDSSCRFLFHKSDCQQWKQSVQDINGEILCGEQ
jgi:D-aminoacyl-tRNA deacylase